MIQNEIKEVLGKNITFFNGAPSLANHLKKLLKEKTLLQDNGGIIKFIDSQNLEEKQQRFYQILKEEE